MRSPMDHIHFIYSKSVILILSTTNSRYHHEHLSFSRPTPNNILKMKAFHLALTIGLAAAIPQGLPPDVENLPDCALNGLPAILASSGCQGIDVDCLCSKPDLSAQLNSAVNDACDNESDRNAIKSFVAGFCPASSISATPSTTASPESSSEMPTSEASTTMEMTTDTTSMMMPTSTATTTMNGTNGTSPTYNSPSPSDTGVVPSEGGAANHGVSLFAFVVAMGGMTWAFAGL